MKSKHDLSLHILITNKTDSKIESLAELSGLGVVHMKNT